LISNELESEEQKIAISKKRKMDDLANYKFVDKSRIKKFKKSVS